MTDYYHIYTTTWKTWRARQDRKAREMFGGLLKDDPNEKPKTYEQIREEKLKEDPIDWRFQQIKSQHPDWHQDHPRLHERAWIRKNDKFGRMASRLQKTHKVPNFMIIRQMQAAGAKKASSGRSSG